ncbi:unnamed protein product [Rotaria sordida]|uniref:Cullin neddylation domain-containing protein n=2 Tax=Rotaria sordida TaxID=392033 RepID=A0A814L7M5_9BILA|nr:unnamed protein product [Rotaria sordida]
MNSKIKLHNEFTSERIRVNLSMGSEPTREKDINETIENDRELVIQASVVRIMKERKFLKYSLLTQEVIEKLSLRFKPKIPLTKCVNMSLYQSWSDLICTPIDGAATIIQSPYLAMISIPDDTQAIIDCIYTFGSVVIDEYFYDVL